MTTTPLTEQQLDEIAARAAALYEYATVTDQEGQDALDELTDTDVPTLLAEVRRLRAGLAASQPGAEDTLPAWLYSRFNDRLDAPSWDRLGDDDRTYWEHQARAVRRAVARGGFKPDRDVVIAASEIELEGGDVMLQELSVGDPIEIEKQTGPLGPGIWVITAFECERRCKARVRRLSVEEIRAARGREATARIYE